MLRKKFFDVFTAVLITISTMTSLELLRLDLFKISLQITYIKLYDIQTHQMQNGTTNGMAPISAPYLLPLRSYGRKSAFVRFGAETRARNRVFLKIKSLISQKRLDATVPNYRQT